MPDEHQLSSSELCDLLLATGSPSIWAEMNAALTTIAQRHGLIETTADNPDSVKLRYEAQDADHGDEFLATLVADGMIPDADYRSGTYHPRNGELTVTADQAARILVPFAFGSKVAVWREQDEHATAEHEPDNEDYSDLSRKALTASLPDAERAAADTLAKRLNGENA